MTDASRRAFLAGERPDDVLVYLAARAVSDVEPLAEYGERVNEGIVFVLDAERGRRIAKQALGTDPMDLASAAMDVEGTIDLVRFRGGCPTAGAVSGSPSRFDPDDSTDTEAADASGDSGRFDTVDFDDHDAGESHALRGTFAFAEERNETVGGIYAEGDVIHAYAVCSCGTAYSDRWVSDERDQSD